MNQWRSATLRKYLFIGSSFLIVSIFFILRFFYLRELDKPTACVCAKIFQSDSSISVRAARLVVGNGHYQYTVQTAQRECVSFYRLGITEWRKTNKSDFDSTQAASKYFQQYCPGD